MLAAIFGHFSGFSDLQPSGAAVGREKRRSHRLYTDIPIEYRVSFQDKQGSLASRATMKNISKGGAFLECDTPPALTLGQVGYFTFRSLAGSVETAGVIHLAAKAVVRRLSSAPHGSFSFGLAVEFLSGPLIAYQ